MEFINKLKKKSIRRSVLWGILWTALGIALLAGSQVFMLLAGPAYLYDVPESELPGAYVTVEVPFIYGSYAEVEEYENDVPTGRITSVEVIIDANERAYCGLSLPEALVSQGEALMAESFDYMDGLTGEVSSTFTVTGVMKRMDEDRSYYYRDALDWFSMTEEERDLFLTLYLDPRTTGDNVSSVILALLGLGCFAAAVILVVRSAQGKHQAQLAAKAEAIHPGNPEYVYGRLAQLCQDQKAVHGLRFDRELIYLEQGSNQSLYTAQELCWAYQQKTTQKLYGILPMGSSYALMLCTYEGEVKSVPMAPKQVEAQLQRLEELIPGCVIGYSQELAQLYQNSRQQFAQIAASQRARRETTPEV